MAEEIARTEAVQITARMSTGDQYAVQSLSYDVSRDTTPIYRAGSREAGPVEFASGPQRITGSVIFSGGSIPFLDQPFDIIIRSQTWEAQMEMVIRGAMALPQTEVAFQAQSIIPWRPIEMPINENPPGINIHEVI